MKSWRVEIALGLLIVIVAVGMILTTPGCATLAEQDQQRREIIELMHSDNAQWRAIRELQGGDPEGWE